MDRMRAAGGVIGVGLGLLALSGCGDPDAVTEVVVLIDSDLPLPIQADSLEIKVSTSTGTQTYGQPVPTFPAKLGMVPHSAFDLLPAAGGEPFSVRASLVICDPITFTLVQREVSGIRFVHGEKRVVVLTLLRACVCQGTSCPDPGAVPECADVTNPTLSVLDTGPIPRLPVSVDDARRDAAAGQPSCGRRPGLDARANRPPEAPVDAPAETGADRPADVPADRSVDVADVAAEASSDAGDAGDAGNAGDAGDAGDAGAVGNVGDVVDGGDAGDARDGAAEMAP